MTKSGPHLELFAAGDRSTLTAILEAFDPSRLTQARVLAELTKSELSDQIGVSSAAVGQYEAGVSKPRTEVLAALAKCVDVPVEFFATGRPIGRLDAADAHFRSLRSTRAKDRAKAVAHAEQLWELTYALEKRVRFPDVDLDLAVEGTSPTEAARRLRQTWGLKRGPVPHLAATMESKGIVICLIALTNESVSRVKAYSTDSLGRPLVIVTPERFKSVYEYRFTCAHELGHLVLHPNALPGDRRQEREADQFAAEFLTPAAEIEPLLPRTVRIPVLEKLSKSWGISIESLIYRMGELRIVSDASIRRAYQRLAGMSELRRAEPLSSYPGEVPSLLREAADLAMQHGFTYADLASELVWPRRHLVEMLGGVDDRPALSVVRDDRM